MGTAYLELSGYSQKELGEWELPLMAAHLAEGVPEEERSNLLAILHRQVG